MARTVTTRTKTKAPRARRTPAKKDTLGSRQQLSLNFSTYPDLTLAISMLTKRQSGAEGNHAELIARWVEQLTQIQSEITKVKRLESLTAAVSRPIPKE